MREERKNVGEEWSKTFVVRIRKRKREGNRINRLFSCEKEHSEEGFFVRFDLPWYKATTTVGHLHRGFPRGMEKGEGEGLYRAKNRESFHEKFPLVLSSLPGSSSFQPTEHVLSFPFSFSFFLSPSSP